MSIWSGEKEKALERLNEDQMVDYEKAMAAMKGLTTHQAAVALSEYGADWRGCPKWHIAVEFATGDCGFRGWSIEKFVGLCNEKKVKVAKQKVKTIWPAPTLQPAVEKDVPIIYIAVDYNCNIDVHETFDALWLQIVEDYPAPFECDLFLDVSRPFELTKETLQDGLKRLGKCQLSVRGGYNTYIKRHVLK